jgi:hypothetical protein
MGRFLKFLDAGLTETFQQEKTTMDMDELKSFEDRGIPGNRADFSQLSGWESRSGTSPYQSYMIFEVGGILEASQFKAYATGEKLGFKAVLGSWRGTHNPAFVMADTPSNRLAIAFWVKGQEAILCLGPAYRKNSQGLGQLFGNREAILDWLAPDGYTVTSREPLQGLFSPISQKEADGLASWTFDPTENQYYGVV